MLARIAPMMLIRVGFFFSLGLSSAFAQSSSDAAVQALTAEVRQLRTAIERSAGTGLKIQLALQRLQVQQDKLSHTTHDWETARTELIRHTSQHTNAVQELRRLEEYLARETDANHRKQFEERVASLKSMIEAETSTTGELQSRESELGNRVRAEQAKVDAINQRINSLEQDLEAAPPK